MKLSKTMKTAFLYFIGILFITSCSTKHRTDYNYQFEVRVIFTNGDIDTVYCERNSFKGNEVGIWLKTESGLLQGGMSPTLIMQCGLYQTTLVSEVRYFNVLKTTRTEL